MKNIITLLLILAFILQTGCTAIVVGGGAAAVIADQRTAGDMLEDENIEIKFSYHFYKEKNLSNISHVNATSYNRWLLLTGETATLETKRALYNLAMTIKNAKRVFNELKIAAPSSLATRASDTFLTSKVKTLLLAETSLTGYHIKVVSENGTVYLMGLVSEEKANQATNIARQVQGVQNVVKLFDYQ